MNKFEDANKFVEREYPYYFKYMNAHPWSFEGIMADIQHALYNGDGLTRNDKNLSRRIDSLMDSSKRATAYNELMKAERLYAERANQRKSKYEAEQNRAKKAAISEYKKQWRNKGFFYKLTHGKKNPKKMDFDDMSMRDIEWAQKGLNR